MRHLVRCSLYDVSSNIDAVPYNLLRPIVCKIPYIVLKNRTQQLLFKQLRVPPLIRKIRGTLKSCTRATLAFASAKGLKGVRRGMEAVCGSKRWGQGVGGVIVNLMCLFK